MNPENYLNRENKIEKLFVNGLLFSGLRGGEKINDKLRNLEKYLTTGADVNAPDANDGNNTPLHIAVEKNEPQIVKFLLQKGANVKAKNKNKHTPLDLAISYNKHHTEIINLLQTALNSIPNQKRESDHINLEKEPQNIPCKVREVKIKETALNNESRSGTAGISGQLYETNLIGLLLHRALKDQTIDKFYLGSNISGLGAFDDIVFKYYLKNATTSKIFFIQAKHRDNPTKDKVTIDSVLKTNGDFSLDKYFESYLKIRQKIVHNKCRSIMFQNDFRVFDCKFIIYTTAVECFSRKKLVKFQNEEKKIVPSSDEGKTFMFDYNNDDVETLLKNTLMSRTKGLAKAFAKNIVKNKYKNMMWDELIQIYHIFIAQNIIQISDEEPEDYLKARFRKSFLESKNEVLVLMKETINKELNLHNKSLLNPVEIDLEFKIPKHFGNVGLTLNDEEYIKLCNIVENLMKLGSKLNDIITIVVDDTMVGTKKLLKKDDITLIKKSLGITLILDDKTGLLKFNTEESASEKNKKFIKMLKLTETVENDLQNVRLDISIQNFPQLSLSNGTPMKIALTDFLNKLTFYTNQKDEEGIENVMKYELNERYLSENINSDAFFLIKSDAIYLQYHDKIQKWWKHSTEYLSKSCKFYDEAKQVILDSPLLNIYSDIYKRKMNDFQLNFDQKAVDVLGLKEFMSISSANVCHIITKDVTLTSIKVIQYCRDVKLQLNYKIIDWDVVTTQGYSELIISDISILTIDVIVIVSNDASNLIKLDLHKVQKNVKKLIVISYLSSLTEYFESYLDCMEQRDQNNSFSDLDQKTKLSICQHSKILFQGFEVPFVSIVDKNMIHFVKEKVLLELMSNGMIKIGKKPMNIEKYYKTYQFYIERQLCRCLTLDGKEYCKDFNVFEVNGQKEQNKWTAIGNNKDILIISNDDAEFETACKLHININVHWFKRTNESQLLWVKSNGSLQKIYPYVKRVKCQKPCLREPKSFKHMKDRVIIINGGPGMGKSTLLTHLMIQTKHFYTSMCIIYVNLLDLKNEFSTWHTCDEDKRKKWFLSILYKLFSTNEIDFLNSDGKKTIGVYFDAPLNDVENPNHSNSEETMSNIQEIVRFELHTFLNLYNNGKISIMLDGFDEICPDYKKEATELLKFLIVSRIQHIWLTTRSYIVKELERELNTFSYTLKGFSTNDQLSFLELSFNTMSDRVDPYLRLTVERILNNITIKIKDHKRDFTSTPIHLRMIAEIYLEHFRNIKFTQHYEENSLGSTELCSYRVAYDPFNLISLYEKFIEIKFHKIRFGEKKNGLCAKDPDIKILIDRERSFFIENHKKLAAYALLDRQNNAGLLTNEDLKHVKELVNKFNFGEEKTGIIGMISNNEPIFVHFTYAEYFACEFLYDKLIQNIEPAWKYLIDHILVMGNEGIRGFFDAKLENDQILSNFTSIYICEALLAQKSFTKSALYTAVLEGRRDITLFLLNNLKKYVNKENLDDFLVMSKKLSGNLCNSINDKQNIHTHIITEIIKIIKPLDCNRLFELTFFEDGLMLNIFSVAFCRRCHGKEENAIIDNLDLFVKYMTSQQLMDSIIEPFDAFNKMIHLISNLNTSFCILNYLEKLNHEQLMGMFSVRDYMQRTPAHYAAEMNNYEFFDKMLYLIGNKEFKTIVCTLTDMHGSIPLICFETVCKPPLFASEKFRSLCAKAGVGIGMTREGGTSLYDLENPNFLYLLYLPSLP